MKLLYALITLLFICVAHATTYRLPTQLQIAEHQCGAANPEPYIVTGTDPGTGYQSGKVWAWAACSAGGRGAGTVYYWGCASTVWDGNGVLISYTIEYRGYGRQLAPSSDCLTP
jgi:hypothetical protein